MQEKYQGEKDCEAGDDNDDDNIIIIIIIIIIITDHPSGQTAQKLEMDR